VYLLSELDGAIWRYEPALRGGIWNTRRGAATSAGNSGGSAVQHANAIVRAYKLRLGRITAGLFRRKKFIHAHKALLHFTKVNGSHRLEVFPRASFTSMIISP
jgi:hypothetical protein